MTHMQEAAVNTLKAVALSLLTYWFLLGGAERFLTWLFALNSPPPIALR